MHLHARIRHAERYPYDRPVRSYRFEDGAFRPLGALDREGRTPVIAAGSNAAPERLAAKFAGQGAVIPVTRAALHDHAVVHAAHFSSYGAVPATIHPCPGAVAEVFVTWLTAAQLAHMHVSEGVGQRYDYMELQGLVLEVEGHGHHGWAGAYLSRNGALTHDGEAIRLDAVPTRNCAHPPRTQAAVLRLVHRRLAPESPYRRFMARILESTAYRTRASTALATTALPWPGQR